MNAKKLNVLIVEDEYKIGMLIKKLIDWDKLNLNFTQFANNGQKALEIILNEKPNIVITDIQMPILSGLDLINKTKHLDIEYVVISGYKDFEYAHAALEYGVNSYLLKPIKASELNDTLEKLSLSLQNKIKSAEENTKIREEIKLSKKIIDSNILKEIISENTRPDLVYIKDKYGVDFDFPLFKIIDIKLDYRDFKKTDKKQDILTIEKVVNVIDKEFDSNNIQKLTYVDKNLNIFYLLNYSKDISNDINEYINKVLIALEEYLLGFEQYEVSIGVGLEKNAFKNTIDSYNEALLAVQNRISAGTRTIIFYKETNVIICELIDKTFNDEIKNYISSIKSYNADEFRQSINEIFNKANSSFFDDFSYAYYYLTERLIDIFFNNINDINDEIKNFQNYLLNISQHCYLDLQLKKILYFKLGDFLIDYKKSLEVKLTKPIREAKKYIEQNYEKKITLDEIAEIVDLNPVYLSVVFKKETGLNFSNYVLNFKMEKAKEMLRDNNETIAAVAIKLGYKDTRYFSKLFLKTVGIKPSVFRRLYS